ncbi:hypothetical protein OCU04_005793 [Sclerotinia nivalis]|uniref:Uncharacterized protein n=1 Tax=Sclerotinia nivalis TaxID=352851 RepID=A0A9X0ALP3_9HELO|nr:hypothetical protein OCU04_005793 [Sclerotinia nivalis]
MSHATRIAVLAAKIQEHTSKVDEYLASNNLPSPSFDVSCPVRLSLPPEIQTSRNAVLEASDELTALMLGPVESLIPPIYPSKPYSLQPTQNPSPQPALPLSPKSPKHALSPNPTPGV